MGEFESRDDVVRTGNHFYKHILKYEITASLAIVSGIVMNLFDKPGRLLVTGSLLMMAVIYFFLAFSTISKEEGGKTEQFIFRLNNWVSSLSLTGLIFLIHRLPFADTIALFGAIPLLLLALVMLIMKKQQPGSNLITLITIARSLVIGLLVIIYYLIKAH